MVRAVLLRCVSTHSRLKAAGFKSVCCCKLFLSFNTQPPEGGWINIIVTIETVSVSTHSRLKAAGR